MSKLSLLIAVCVVAACQPASDQTDTAALPGSPDSVATPSPAPENPGSGGTSSADTTRPGQSGGVTLTVDKSSYAAGGQVQLTITSRSRDTLGFNPCNRILERQSGSAWTVHPEPNRVCTMELWLLEPGATRTAQTEIPAGAPAGTYRMVIQFSPQTSRPAQPVRGTSNTFRVQ